MADRLSVSIYLHLSLSLSLCVPYCLRKCSFRAQQPLNTVTNASVACSTNYNAYHLLLSVVTSQTSLAASLQSSSYSVAPALSSAVAIANQAGRLNTSVVVAMDTSRLTSLTIPPNFAAGDGEFRLRSLLEQAECLGCGVLEFLCSLEGK